MIAMGRARRWRLKRKTKRATLLALRIARRHYLSIVSFSILGIALVIAMTNSIVDSPVSTPVASLAASPAVTPVVAAAPVASAVAGRSIVYYFIDSPAVRREIELAVHRDLTDDSLRNYAPLHSVSRVFIMVKDARDEAEALELLRQLALSPPADGSTVRVVDLR